VDFFGEEEEEEEEEEGWSVGFWRGEAGWLMRAFP
jgi:hypothetical protein